MRDYVLLEEFDRDENDQLTPKSTIREQMIKDLAKQWNEIEQAIERRSYADDWELAEDYHREARYEFVMDRVDLAVRANPNLSKEEIKEIKDMAKDEYEHLREQEDNKIYLQQQGIEEMLLELGARMARPYEHWNEDERYMEYMENRYDSYGEY